MYLESIKGFLTDRFIILTNKLKYRYRTRWQKTLEDLELGNHYFIIAGEEAGPKSNKMGGIWNVIDGEAHTLATLFNSGTLESKDEMKILVAGPYYGYRGADWNRGLESDYEYGGV